MIMPSQSIKNEIDQLETEIERLSVTPLSLPFSETKNQSGARHFVKNTFSPRSNPSYSARTVNDRRSGEDQREVGDLTYFKRGGMERRSYTERRTKLERRLSQSPTKSRGLTSFLRR